jgi:uncharacterized protein
MPRRYVPRDIEPRILTAAEQFPVVVVTGPRQSGKSTLLTELFPDYGYVNLDDPVARRTAVQDPGLFVDRCPDHCIVDEVQYAPEILPYIKMRVDGDRSKTGVFFLTGSEVFPLMQGLSESLAGRAAIFELLGLSSREYPVGSTDVSDLFQRCFTGAYPEPLVHRVDRSIYYGGYLQTYVERDVRRVESVRDLIVFQQFLELVAARVGGLLNLSELARDAGVSQPTARRWLSILETSRIVYLLRPFHRNITKRTTKAPKVYFTDTGLLSYLLKYPDWRSLSSGPQAGAIFENHIVIEFLKEKLNHGYLYELFFYRDSNQNEIDLVIDRGRSTQLCEIKLAKTVRPRHYSTLSRLAPEFPEPRSYLVSLYPERIPLDRTVQNAPFSAVADLARGE